MQQWEFLIINVMYRDGSDSVIRTVSSNYHRVFSNILKDELEAYLRKLGEEGWVLEDVHRSEEGDEAYYFKRPLEKEDGTDGDRSLFG